MLHRELSCGVCGTETVTEHDDFGNLADEDAQYAGDLKREQRENDREREDDVLVDDRRPPLACCRACEMRRRSWPVKATSADAAYALTRYHLELATRPGFWLGADIPGLTGDIPSELR